MRLSIINGTLQQFITKFLSDWYQDGDGFVPNWVRDALAAVDLSVGRWGADQKQANIIIAERNHKKGTTATSIANENEQNTMNDDDVNMIETTSNTTSDSIDLDDDSMTSQHVTSAVVGKRKEHPTIENSCV